MRRRVEKMKRIFTALGLCAVMATAPTVIVNAEDAGGETEEVQNVEYDLEKGGTQSFEVLDEDGEETEIIVEEVPGIARVAKGTYKISRNKKGCWTAGFYVDVSGNKFVKAHDKFYKAVKGKISNVSLLKNSGTRVTLTLKYEDGYSQLSKVIAKISNKKIVMEVAL